MRLHAPVKEIKQKLFRFPAAAALPFARAHPHLRNSATNRTMEPMTEPAVTPFSHRALGPMLRMTLAEGLSFDLTPLEAQTLSLALAAVTRDRQRTNDIYLSPLASDGDFSAEVTQDGLQVAAADGTRHLSWPVVAFLAERLTAGASENGDHQGEETV
jgi:hypothetical protein